MNSTRKPRKLISLTTGKRILELVQKKTWYDMLAASDVPVFTPGREKQAELIERARIHDLYAGPQNSKQRLLKDPKRVLADRMVEKNPPFKKLDVYPKNRRGAGGRWVYKCYCHCGSVPWLTAEEILDRNDVGLGCGRARCVAPQVNLRAWYLPKVALTLQFRQAAALFPEWAKRKIRGRTMEQVIKSIYANAELLAQIQEGRFWILGIADEQHIKHTRLTLTSEPDMELFPDGEVHTKLGEWVVSLPELCETYEVDLDEALNLRLNLDDEQLVAELLGEKL